MLALVLTGCPNEGNDGKSGSQGEAGPQGISGINCWDLNENSVEISMRT